jgi:hypothetical protein
VLYNGQIVSYATLKAYTDNGTLGNAVGTIRVADLAIPTSGTVQNPLLFDFKSSPISLLSSQESLCVNFSGASLSGPSIDIWVEWGER